MATRSLIIIDIDNTITSQYCHYDGGLNSVGNILASSYIEHKKIIKLRKLGDLSALDYNCTKPKGHSFHTPVKGYCISYKRDRKCKDSDATFHSNLKDAIDWAGDMIAFIYVYTNGVWNVYVRGYLIPINPTHTYTYI